MVTVTNTGMDADKATATDMDTATHWEPMPGPTLLMTMPTPLVTTPSDISRGKQVTHGASYSPYRMVVDPKFDLCLLMIDNLMFLCQFEVLSILSYQC